MQPENKIEDWPLWVMPLSNTGIGVRAHDPAHRVNAAVPQGQVGISLDTGFEYEDGVGVYGTERSKVALFVGPKDQLIKELEQVLALLKGSTA